MGLFDGIPVRLNGQQIDSGWFNTIRTKLMAAFGYVDSNSGTPFTIVTNRSSYTDITGLLFDKTVAHTYIVRYSAYRKDATPTERKEVGSIVASYKTVANSWTYSRRVDHDSDDVFNMTDSLYVDPTTGQAQYKSDNMAGGSYVGQFEWKIVATFGV